MKTEKQIIHESNKWSQIEAACTDLNEDELEIILLVAQGLAAGKHTYGPLELETDQRNMKQEAVQELRDCLVYINAALLKLIRIRCTSSP